MLMLFWRDDRAATAIEYCLIAGLVSVAVVAGATTIGTRLSVIFGRVAANLS